MELNFEKFRENKNDFKMSTKRNFQFSKFWSLNFEAFYFFQQSKVKI